MCLAVGLAVGLNSPSAKFRFCTFAAASPPIVEQLFHWLSQPHSQTIETIVLHCLVRELLNGKKCKTRTKLDTRNTILGIHRLQSGFVR